MIEILEKRYMDTQEMRYAYRDTMIELAQEDPRIVAIHNDLESSCGMTGFSEKYPDRSFNMGVQEANSCSVAAGMAAAGLIPFFHSFAIFSSRRIYDQAFISCAYAGLNVKIIGFDAGISATYNGGTHMAFEDIGLYRSMPTVTIIEPSDTVMMRSLVKQMAKTHGIFYMRSPRKLAERIYKDGTEFEIGKGALIRQGTDVTIFASGMEVAEALKAAEELEKQNISVRVVDIFTIKPIDKELIIKCAKETGAVVTAENANIIGGLGSAVAEVLSENIPTPLERLGVEDRFGAVGEVDYLREHFNLGYKTIMEKVQKVLSRKGQKG